jgi:hypothetical protein
VACKKCETYLYLSSYKVPGILVRFSRQIFVKYANTKFHENSCSEIRVVPYRGVEAQTDILTEMTQLIVSSHVVANAPKYWLFQHVYFPVCNRLYFCYMRVIL